ncbi:MAG: CBS domain-containing protein [candidate division Zixibacteria bacterium]|nr:CBS domain-containing protein [candidate division Zixibacteria bacterium]
MRISDLLKVKGSGVITAQSHITMRQVLKQMIDNKVGSVVVLDKDNNPIGIFTERDTIRMVYKQDGRDWQSKAISEFMTTEIMIGVPDDDVEYVMALMTDNRFRHVPIMSEGKLIGLISIGDIVKSLLKNIKIENRYLSDYISGKYPA